MIYLRRGDEWATIQPFAEEDVLWLYGEGELSNGRGHGVCPRALMTSNLADHLSKGWEIVFSLEENSLAVC